MGDEKIGRNDPCPCGSGKKYKRCCLSKSTAPYSQQDRATAFQKLLVFIETVVRKEKSEALDEFWGEYSDRKAELGPNWHELSEAAFNHYFAFDMEWCDGQRLIDIFLAAPENDDFLSPAERDFFQILRATSMHLYELIDLVPGVSVTLRDLLEGQEITVHERSGSRTMPRFEWFAARINPQGASGKPEIECILQMSRFVRDQVLSQLKEMRADFLRTQPGNITEFYKEMPPFFHEAWLHSIIDPPIPKLANTDGEEMVYTRVHFDILDSVAAQTALDGEKSLQRADDLSWCWSGKNQRGELVTFGNMNIRDQSLILEANSVMRGENGRALLD